MSPTGAGALLTPRSFWETLVFGPFELIFCALQCVFEAIPALWTFLNSGWGRLNSVARDDLFSLPFPPCKSDCGSKQGKGWRAGKSTEGTTLAYLCSCGNL